MARFWWIGGSCGASRRWGVVALVLLCSVIVTPVGARAMSSSAYVGNIAANDISQFDIGASGALAPKTPATVAGNEPASVAVSPDAKSLYAVSFGAKVLEYDIGSGGALSVKTTATVGAGTAPSGIAISPDGSSVYVTDNGLGTVLQYDVGPGGELSPKTPATVNAAGQVNGIAVSPDGKSVYVTDAGVNEISQYDVGPGGGLSPKTPATVAAGSTPIAIAISPDGKSVYVSENGSGTVSQYDVGAGGLLSPKTPTGATAGGGAEGVAVSPDGESVYVANGSDNTVSQYDVGAGGVLSPKAPATVAAGVGPRAIAISSDGKSVYVTGVSDGKVSQYDAGPGGALSAKTPSAVASGSSADGVVVVPDQGPAAAFSDNATAAGSPTSFDGSASHDADGTIARYDWDFGDGAALPNGGPAPSHTYAAAGTYIAALTVTDDGGCSAALVFTGQTASCNGSPAALVTRTITVAPAPTPAVSTPLTAPAVTGLRLHPQRFRAARQGSSVKPSATTGTHVSYKLSIAARVGFTVQRAAAGRLVGGRCVRPTGTNRGHRSCTRYVPVRGRFTRSRPAGSDRFAFTGRLAGHALLPGRYRLAATPTANGKTGKATYASFRVVR